jgi:hypothetical protein
MACLRGRGGRDGEKRRQKKREMEIEEIEKTSWAVEMRGGLRAGLTKL